VIPTRLRRVALAAVLGAAALPAAASGATTTEFKLSLPDRDPRIERLQLRASCSTACTVKPVKVGATATRAGGIGVGEQLPGGFEGPIRAQAKRLKPGKAATFTFRVPGRVSRQIAGALVRRNVAYVKVSVTVTPSGEPSYPAIRQAAIHAKDTQVTKYESVDDIVPGEAIDRGKANPRYAVTVEGTQSTTWSYTRDADRGDGCRIIANGSGKEDLIFTSPKPVETELLRDKQGRPALVASDPWPFARVPVRISATREGVRNAGAEGASCGNGGAGGCTDPGDPSCGPTTNPACTRTGALDAEVILGYGGRKGLLSAASNMWGLEVPPDQKPDCPVEQWAGYDWHLLDAELMKRSDPKIAGAAKKFIVQERRSKTRKLDGGSVKVSVRWVITFRKLN
jgi:hypothetical protein